MVILGLNSFGIYVLLLAAFLAWTLFASHLPGGTTKSIPDLLSDRLTGKSRSMGSQFTTEPSEVHTTGMHGFAQIIRSEF